MSHRDSQKGFYHMMVLVLYSMILLVGLIINRKSLRSRKWFNSQIYKSIKKQHVALGAVSILSAIIVGYGLYMIPVDFLKFGYLRLLSDSIGSTVEGASNEQEASADVLIAAKTIVTIIVLAVIGITVKFTQVIPTYAYNEELAFRKPLLEASLWKVFSGSLVFGLLHMTMGIPLAAALALSVPGVIFAYVARHAYRKYQDADHQEILQYAVTTGDWCGYDFTDYEKTIIHQLLYSDAEQSANNVQTINKEVTLDFFMDKMKHQEAESAILQSTLVHTCHNVIAFGLITICVLLYTATVLFL